MKIHMDFNQKHYDLLALQKQPPPDFRAQVQQFIKELQYGGSDVYNARERDQLRGYLRFWSSALHEMDPSQSYKVLELEVYAGPIPKTRNWLWFGLGLVSIFLLVSITLINSAPQISPPATETKTSLIKFTPTTQPVTITPSLTPTPSSTPTILPTPTNSPVVHSPTIVPISGFQFSITNPVAGQEISPIVEFKGKYQNLRTGWTIHVILQPVSKQGRYYPLRNIYTVPAGQESGEWSVSADLGEQFDLSKGDKYILSLAIANSDAIRALLERGSVSGFDKIPDEVITGRISEVLVPIKAYTRNQQARLVYSSVLETEGNSEIFSTSLDGKDTQRLTFTPLFNERFPSISSDGRKIVYVGSRLDEKGNFVQSIWMMDSNGQNQVKLYEHSLYVIESPVLSPDGRRLVFSAQDLAVRDQTDFRLYLLNLDELAKKAPPQVLTPDVSLENRIMSCRYPSWLDINSILFTHRVSAANTLFKLDLRGLKMEPIFDYKQVVLVPALSKDKNNIAFIYVSTNPDTTNEVFLGRLDKPGEATQLTKNEKVKNWPAWDIEGRTIYFESYNGSDSTIWAVNQDGTNLRQITSGKGSSDTNPVVGVIISYQRLP